ncbi:hypothetical protein [Noviherbaspirillum sp. ST9]|uniref:hypothetical protein n=1 Tax=Noviherbaspirillum sp. ST9 TaxID=3401606 RepID=UPI003B586877
MKAMKTLFIWLLMFFIPLQGMAANALLVCKAANQAAVVSYAMPESGHAHPCGEMQVQQDDMQDTPQVSEKTCAAQYAGVPWIPASELHLPPFEPVPAVVSYAGFHLPFFIPDGPDRPPRRHSL